LRRAKAHARTAAACILAVGLGGASSAWSQSLIEALSTTYNSNPDLLASRAILRQTDETLSQAVANWRPRVTLNVEYNKVEQDSYSVRSTPTFYALNGKFTTLQMVQPIFRGGKTIAETKQAQSNIQAQRAQLAENDLIVRVADPDDGRRVHVELAPVTVRALRACLLEARRMVMGAG